MQDTRLVRHILRAGGVAPDDCAVYLGIKKRTLRDRIRHANESMDGCARIVYDRPSGHYEVSVENEDALQAWLRGETPRNAIDRLPSTPEERVNYLIQDLLSRADWITLEDLASMLFVSRSTISNDLRSVERVLAKHGLSIEKRPRYGLRVTGDEMSRRLCLASIAVDAFLASDNLTGVGAAAALGDVERCVREALDEEGYEINPVSRQNLVVHVAIALARINKGCYVPMEASYLENVRSSREHAVAGTVARAIEKRFGTSLPEEEIAYIAIHLASKRLVESDEAKGAGAPPLEISDEAWSLAAEMIEVVWRAFRFDFRDDAELRVNLARHIMPLIVRLRYHMTLENPLLADIRVSYPLPLAMAADAASVLAEKFDADVSDDEVGYIALLFALSLERKATSYAKKHVLVVCASGVGSARLLAYRLQSEFSSNFETVETCDASEFEERDISDIDYIFTTVPLERHVSIPVVHVSLFLDDSSKRDVRRVIDQSEAESAQSYFSPELFFAHAPLASREEVISFLCERAADVVGLPENFEELVWKRERAAATSFGNLVALPHPYEAVSPRTFVAVALLDHPVDWGGNPAQAVFLVGVAHDAGIDLEAFYRSMVGLFTTEKAIQRILGDMRLEVLLNELEGE